MHRSTSGQYNTLHDIMIAIPYVSITHRIARRLQLYSEMGSVSAEDFYFDANFRLQPKHLKGMETDNSIMECFPDSSKLDNVIGDDSFLLLALKNDVKERVLKQPEVGKALLPIFLELEMNYPKSKILHSNNRMMKVIRKVWLMQDPNK